MRRHDRGGDELLSTLWAQMESSGAPEIDAELMAAFGEGRLDGVEAEEVAEQIRQSPAARVELRALFPERWAELFEGAAPAPRRRARIWIGAAAAVAAGVVGLALWPSSPPEGAGFDLVAVRHARRTVDITLPAQRFMLMMRLGEIGVVDRLLGAESYGALLVERGAGVELVCTSEDPVCRSTEQTMTWILEMPRTPGASVRAAFVAAARPVRGELSELLAKGLSFDDVVEAAQTLDGVRVEGRRHLVVQGTP